MSPATLAVGDKVEGRFRGGRRWFPGVIGRVNLDGTYNVDYDDGDKERGVKPEMVRRVGGGDRGDRGQSSRSPSPVQDRRDPPRHSPSPLGTRDSVAAPSRLRVGMKVEARFRGGSRWFRGVIARDHRDGTFDVDYDDGDKERDVKDSFIRPVRAGQGPGTRVHSPTDDLDARPRSRPGGRRLSPVAPRSRRSASP